MQHWSSFAILQDSIEIYLNYNETYCESLNLRSAGQCCDETDGVNTAQRIHDQCGEDGTRSEEKKSYMKKCL